MTSTLLMTTLVWGALMQVQVVPWTPGSSSCFAADANMDGRAEIFVLEGHRLRVYGRRHTDPTLELMLPAGTAAIDVADIDHDNAAELVAIRGESVQAFPLQGESPAPRTLFTLENQYSHAAGRPFPSVLVVDREGTPKIALPQTNALEIRSLSGELAETYPVDVHTPRHLSISRPFSYWVNQYAQAGPADALEFRISSVVSFQPLETREPVPIDFEPPAARLGTRRQQLEAPDDRPEGWPWFTAGADLAFEYRALYAAAAGQPATTAIRIRTTPRDSGAGNMKIGPVRHYPGALILRQGQLPDFNGDGFTDILLWKTRQPSLTADSLSRAASRKTWPLSLTAHQFLPDKGRYAPRPFSHLSLEVPLAWWISPTSNGPLREILLRDFNGDGRTDLGCCTGEDTLAIWQAGESGFSESPDFEYRFPARIDGVLLEADLEGGGSTTLALPSGDRLHVVRPWSPLARF